MLRVSGLHRRVALALALAAALGGAVIFSACTAEMRAEVEALAGVNAIRQQNGLPPLQADAALTDVARFRSRDMASKGYFSHDPPDGCNYACIMDSRSIPYSYAGENIAWNTWSWADTAEVAVNMWRNSPPHMANILNCHYQRIGVGVARASDGRIYFTTVFEGHAAC